YGVRAPECYYLHTTAWIWISSAIVLVVSMDPHVAEADATFSEHRCEAMRPSQAQSSARPLFPLPSPPRQRIIKIDGGLAIPLPSTPVWDMEPLLVITSIAAATSSASRRLQYVSLPLSTVVASFFSLALGFRFRVLNFLNNCILTAVVASIHAIIAILHDLCAVACEYDPSSIYGIDFTVVLERPDYGHTSWIQHRVTKEDAMSTFEF
ncbi:hypothetical protein Dimus_017930, partial [Dionaea muscipula]